MSPSRSLSLLLCAALLGCAPAARVRSAAPGPEAGAAGRRVALVLGNSAYRHARPLANPRNDARSVGEQLRRLGFEVDVVLDEGKLGTERALRRFGARLERAELALIYYAGHGLQVAGHNYLVPTDARLQTEADVKVEALDLDDLLAPLERGARVGLVLLDACRDNPLGGAPRAVRSLARGLAPPSTGRGELVIVYATSPGQVAEDGAGSHSPFTAALLKHLPTPGVELQTMLRRVLHSVEEETGGRQRPWQHASLSRDLVLAGGAGGPGPAAAPAAPLDEPPEGMVPVTPADPSRRFFIDRTEVTVAAYGRCVEARQCPPARSHGTGNPRDLCNGDKAGRGDHPINCVSFRDAERYCASLGKRLPVEAEWTAAAGAADGRTYPWGNEPPARRTLCWDLGERLRAEDGVAGTCLAGEHPDDRSPAGALDLAGNVSEWVRADCPAAKPGCAGDGAVLRGGVWFSNEDDEMRIKARKPSADGQGWITIGFRCARSPALPQRGR